eukprot:TRINITY_DN8450_c0_g1_i8.p1 TRINITY_DN8450_c0_g1~~TRINITY_DN8450_c0_g1_i8.p1  ORF type:complete len:123 (+),score=36.68 TRINITY_DN8450_c0_g1_i8:80-448(+)
MSVSIFRVFFFFFFQAEDGIRDAQESRGLGDVYKRQSPIMATTPTSTAPSHLHQVLAAPSGSTTWETACPQPHGTTLLPGWQRSAGGGARLRICCLLYTSDAADEEDSVDLGGRRIIKKKKK